MNATHTIWIYVLAVTMIAAWTDWRTRRIPNWLTVPAVALGIGVNAVAAGWPGVKTSLEGAGLAMAILLPFVALRGLGAGDWKLMTAVGALLGPFLFLIALLASVFVSGLMAVVHLARHGRTMTTLRNVGVLIRGVFTFGFRSRPEISLDNPKLLKVPFGVAAAIATVICYCATRCGVL